MSGRRRLSISSFLTRLIPFLGIAASLPVASNSTTGSCTTPQHNIGQAIIQNSCKFTVLTRSVAGRDASPIITLEPGKTYLENYHNGIYGSGVAIKISNNSTDWSTPMLLEYTPNFPLGLVFYDVSVSVGGKGHGDGGLGITYQLNPSTIEPGTLCVPITYMDSYIHLGEGDLATKSCPVATTITLRLC